MFGFWRILCTVTQLCLILCDPMDCSLPDSSVHGILLARTLEWVAMLSSRGSSQLRDGIHVSYVFCIGRPIRYHWRPLLLFSNSAMSSSFQPHGLQHARLLVHHQLLELAKTHVHQVGDVIQPSHLLSSPSLPAFSISSIRVFSKELALGIR